MTKFIVAILSGIAMIAVLVGIALTTTTGQESEYQGFGSTTQGGTGHPVVHVTNLNDAGPGSLRTALAAGNRTIVFDVAGTINLVNHLYVRGANITVDGFTAPESGITLRGKGPILHGSKGAHDVIVRGIRVRNATIDGFQLAGGAYNIVLDHVSVAGSSDGNIDITNDAHDVTVSWSILGDNVKNLLWKYGSSRMSLHHNLLASNSRNPQARIDDSEAAVAHDTILDMRNNVVASWVGYGTLCWFGAWCNIVDNVYQKSKDALTVDHARAYVAGNVLYTGASVGQTEGTEPTPFPAPPITTTSALEAKAAVFAGAGARPLDAVDQQMIADAGGGSPPPPPPPPTETLVWLYVYAYHGGTVTSSPAGIACATSCKAQFSKGTVVTLTPSGEPLTVWGGACKGTPSTSACRVTTDKGKAASAYFTR